MSVGTATAIGIAGAVGAAGSLGAAALGANAAGNAASTQSNAALQAAQLQHEDAQQALQFQEQQYNTGQQELAPWLQSGQTSLANLDFLLGIGPNSTAAMPSTAAGAPTNTGIGSGGALPMPVARPVSGPTTGARLNVPGSPTGSPIMGPSQSISTSALNGLPAPTANVPQATARTAQPSAPGALSVGANPYAGQSFNELVNSGNPQISPNQQTTQAWKAQGIPFQSITTSDGRSVAVRSDIPGPTASVAPPAGIQPSSAAQVDPSLGA